MLNAVADGPTAHKFRASSPSGGRAADGTKLSTRSGAETLAANHSLADDWPVTRAVFLHARPVGGARFQWAAGEKMCHLPRRLDGLADDGTSGGAPKVEEAAARRRRRLHQWSHGGDGASDDANVRSDDNGDGGGNGGGDGGSDSDDHGDQGGDGGGGDDGGDQGGDSGGGGDDGDLGGPDDDAAVHWFANSQMQARRVAVARLLISPRPSGGRYVS